MYVWILPNVWLFCYNVKGNIFNRVIIMKITVSAPAKINLTLDILGRRDDGYHDVKMIMQTVSLYDNVTLETNDTKRITVACNKSGIPCDDSNIAVKSAKVFFEYTKIPFSGLHIYIDKNIPSQAGLAGGSTDGAAVLKGLNEIYNFTCTQSELENIGSTVGSDIPFCIRGGTVLAEGTGTHLTDLDPMPQCSILLVKPSVNISTAAAYKAADSRTVIPDSATDTVLLLMGDIVRLSENMRNDFETVFPNADIARLKSQLLTADGVLGSCMSGSGSTVFAIFNNEEKAQKAYEHFKKSYADVFLVCPTNCK